MTSKPIHGLPCIMQQGNNDPKELAMYRSLILAFACIISGLLFVPYARAGEDLPSVFDTRPYAEAKKAAAEAKKWFIVKATAVWCPPCKQMDKTTWRDEQVVEWIKANAILVALDVDEEEEVAAELGVEAMPTMIAFKEGDEEFDRVVGYKPPAEMLAWLEGIAKGEKSIEAIRKRAGAPAGERVDVDAKMDLAQSLARERKYTEAADEYVWLWKNMLQHQPAMYGVRLSFMAGYMEQLAQKSEEARAKFVALRDETGLRLEGDKVDMDDLVDWVVLNNRVLNDTDATVEWYDRVKDEPKWRPFINRVSRDLSEMFIKLDRWADVGRLLEDPLAELKSEWNLMRMTSGHDRELPQEIGEEQRKYIEEMPKRMFREKAGHLYAGLLAAEREDVAKKLAVRALKYDSSPEMLKALVGTALEADQPRAIHQRWIAAAKDESLNELADHVAEALNKKPAR